MNRWAKAFLVLAILAIAAIAARRFLTRSVEAPTPWPAGPVHAERVTFELAIFHLPGSTTLTAERVERLRRERFPGLSPAVEEKPATDLYRPSRESLRFHQRGLGDDGTDALLRSERATLLRFTADGHRAAETLRGACSLVLAIARESGGIISDLATREFLSVDAWDERRVRGWSTGGPHVAGQTTIDLYANGEFMRAITLGMEKLGLPDVVAAEFPRSYGNQMVSLINLVCHTIAERGEILESGRLDVAIEGVEDPTLRESLARSLKPNATGRLELAIVVGRRDEGDPENRILEIAFPAVAEGLGLHERQAAALGTLFGSEDSAAITKHDDELEAASRRARERLPELRKRFRGGLAPGERLVVKAPFAISGGGREWMWVEVIRWEDARLRGILDNDPSYIPDLRAGAEVEVDEDAIYDYVLYLPDGREEGNETTRIIFERREREAGR